MIRRGDILLADLGPSVGREQSGRRPVLVVSADEINGLPLVVIVVPGTSADRVTRNYPSNVRVGRTETGLPKDTVFLCFQARAIDPARVHDRTTGAARRIGTMPAGRMAEFDTALRRVLAL